MKINAIEKIEFLKEFANLWVKTYERLNIYRDNWASTETIHEIGERFANMYPEVEWESVKLRWNACIMRSPEDLRHFSETVFHAWVKEVTFSRDTLNREETPKPEGYPENIGEIFDRNFPTLVKGLVPGSPEELFFAGFFKTIEGEVMRRIEKEKFAELKLETKNQYLAALFRLFGQKPFEGESLKDFTARMDERNLRFGYKMPDYTILLRKKCIKYLSDRSEYAKP